MSDSNSGPDISLYAEIAAGYSKIIGKPTFYFRHISYRDSLIVTRKHKEFLEKMYSSGVATEEENLEQAIKNGWWDSKKEKAIKDKRSFLKRSQDTLKNLFIPTDREGVLKQIEVFQNDLMVLLEERASLVAPGVEELVDKKVFEDIVLENSFVDNKLSVPLFDDVDEQEDIFASAINSYNKLENKFSIRNLKVLALDWQFLNVLSITSQPTEIFGRPIFDLTKYQYDLLLYGVFLKGILSNGDVPAPMREDPDKLIEWNSLSTEQKDRYSKTGIDENVIDRIKKAKLKGGQLNLTDK